MAHKLACLPAWYIPPHSRVMLDTTHLFARVLAAPTRLPEFLRCCRCRNSDRKDNRARAGLLDQDEEGESEGDKEV